jgi:hypothetical protein
MFHGAGWEWHDQSQNIDGSMTDYEKEWEEDDEF